MEHEIGKLEPLTAASEETIDLDCNMQGTDDCTHLLIKMAFSTGACSKHSIVHSRTEKIGRKEVLVCANT